MPWPHGREHREEGAEGEGDVGVALEDVEEAEAGDDNFFVVGGAREVGEGGGRGGGVCVGETGLEVL